MLIMNEPNAEFLILVASIVGIWIMSIPIFAFHCQINSQLESKPQGYARMRMGYNFRNVKGGGVGCVGSIKGQ